mmetsp:Transcript_46289/g.145176  ORF Transcript_46289/g.145176 Transcript_46289/m.145176 type:complete len:211 (-) Transcript_46289:47-679(-)
MAWWEAVGMLVGLKLRKMQRELRKAKMRIEELEQCPALPSPPPPSPFPSFSTALHLSCQSSRLEFMSAKEDSNPAMQILSPPSCLLGESLTLSLLPCDDHSCKMSDSFVSAKQGGQVEEKLKLHIVLEPIIRHIENHVENMVSLCTKAKHAYQEQLQLIQQQSAHLERTCTQLSVERDRAISERNVLEAEKILGTWMASKRSHASRHLAG